MNHFDNFAGTWDDNPVHWERSKAIATELLSTVSVNQNMKALEYGAGTGILSFLIHKNFKEITLMDNSVEMVKVMETKVSKTGLVHLKPIHFDLEQNHFNEKFDIIYSQMVFHHVHDIDSLISRFYKLLHPGGYLAIADLYTEDGTFHDYSFTGHLGFNPDELSEKLNRNNFHNIKHKQCYIIKRESANGTIKEYPVFLLTAIK